MPIAIPKHARKQMEKRGIEETDAVEALENGETIFKEVNHRFGLKRYNKLRVGSEDLVVVWFYNKNNEKEIVTVYWRKRGIWDG